MKLFQRLLGGASSSNGLFGFLCFFNPLFSENEFFLNAANAFTDPHFVFRHCVAFTNLGSNGQVWTCVKYVPKQSIP